MQSYAPSVLVSYETLGVWVGPDWQLASLIPWDPILLDYLTMRSRTTHRLIVVQRKMYDKSFYGNMVPDEVHSRYAMVIDGEVLDSKRVKYLTKDSVLAKEYVTQITGLNNWIDAYKGQIDSLRNELAATKYQLDHLRYGVPTSTLGELNNSLASGTTALSGARLAAAFAAGRECCFAALPRSESRSKYPPAEPGALGLEPLEAAGPCCINPHSYSHCAMPPQEPSVLLGHPYLTFW